MNIQDINYYLLLFIDWMLQEYSAKSYMWNVHSNKLEFDQFFFPVGYEEKIILNTKMISFWGLIINLLLAKFWVAESTISWHGSDDNKLAMCAAEVSKPSQSSGPSSESSPISNLNE